MWRREQILNDLEQFNVTTINDMQTSLSSHFIYSSIGLCYLYFPSTHYNKLLSDSVLEKIKAAYFK